LTTSFLRAFIFLCLCASPLAAQDTWRSPRMLSDEWPRPSGSDCADYGARYGYLECGVIRARPAPFASSSVAAPLKSGMQPVAQIKPGHVNAASQRVLPPIPAPIRRPVQADGSCVENMKMCFSQCTGSGNLPVTCNETCSTSTTQCASTLRLNYVQFLDMQTELSQFVRKRLAEGGEAQVKVVKAPAAEAQQADIASGAN